MKSGPMFKLCIATTALQGWFTISLQCKLMDLFIWRITLNVTWPFRLDWLICALVRSCLLRLNCICCCFYTRFANRFAPAFEIFWLCYFFEWHFYCYLNEWFWNGKLYWLGDVFVQIYLFVLLIKDEQFLVLFNETWAEARLNFDICERLIAYLSAYLSNIFFGK